MDFRRGRGIMSELTMSIVCLCLGAGVLALMVKDVGK
jgi:hypothetical protein